MRFKLPLGAVFSADGFLPSGTLPTPRRAFVHVGAVSLDIRSHLRRKSTQDRARLAALT